jgi:hypothetical protein
MTNGATFEIGLYYRDGASNIVTVGATTITNSSSLFPTNTHFTDFQIVIPTVNSNAAWANQRIGVRLASTVGFDKLGGYWDVDNVRLTESVLPNNSFERPETDFASPFLDSWQKAPQPVWYNDPMFPWEQLMGLFLNTTNGSPNHINNMEGKQATFLFALPDVAIFQDFISISGTNAGPTHEFNLSYETGKSYSLTVGVLGGGGGMTNGATFEISFYYRDAASNKVTVAATTITNSASLFPTNTHFTDFSVRVPTVRGDEPWAGRKVGVQLASTVGFDKLGGYWDVDHVRLGVAEDPVLKDASFTNGTSAFTLQSLPGRYEVLASADLVLATAQWTSLGVITNLTGRISVSDTNTSASRFYQVRPAP